jgi:sugar phosphate isomerase/epimerase
MPGRIALFLAAICTFGLTIFPTPLIGYSFWHRVFAIASFVLSAGWHLFAMRTRKDAPWILKPPAAIIGTALQVALALWFLSSWTDPNTTNVGVWERVVAVSQALYVSVVVIVIYIGQRKTNIR